MRRILFAVALGLLFGGCSTTTTFSLLHQPIDIVTSSTDLTVSGRPTRFAYVADHYTRGVIVIDERADAIARTDANPDFTQNPLAVGGEPVALALQDRSSGPRIFVADGLNRSVLAYDAVAPTDPGSDVFAHTPVDLGTTLTGRASRPLFRDNGRTSTPVLDNVTVHESVAQTENWILEYLGDGVGYRVTGSKSGEQATRALEGTAYTSDNGAITFTVVAGGQKTDGGDRFEFGTVVTKPLVLSGIPVDLKTDGTNLYVLTLDPEEVVVIDLATLAQTQAVALTGGSVVPSALAIGDGHLYVSNSADATFFDITMATWTASTPIPGVRARSVGFDPATKIVYFLPVLTHEIVPWDPASAAFLPGIELSDYGFSFTPYVLNSVSYGLVPTAVGGTEVINTATRGRVDTIVIDSATQSQVAGQAFFDTGAPSSPTLISVTTRDGITRSERWQLVFEGVLPDTESSGQISGATLTLLDTSRVVAGDHVVIDPYGSPEEVEILAVASATDLTLGATPAKQGSQQIEIRATKSYIAIGTASGGQKGRIAEGTPYTSDGSEVSLTIRGSRGAPTTRGDYFTFLTTDGVEAIGGGQQRLARKGVVFTPPWGGDPTAYIVEEASGALAVLDLTTLRQRRSIP